MLYHGLGVTASWEILIRKQRLAQHLVHVPFIDDCSGDAHIAYSTISTVYPAPCIDYGLMA